MALPPGPIPQLGPVRPSPFLTMDPRFLPPSARIRNPAIFGAVPDMSVLPPVMPRTQFDPPVEAPPPDAPDQAGVPPMVPPTDTSRLTGVPSPWDTVGAVGGASARSGVAAASSPGKHPGLPDGMTPWDAAGFGGGASALGGLVAGTNPDPHAGMPAVDDAVRQFNEAAANMPPWMFAPGGFWGQQQARINFERAQARQDANNWINQQLGQRMPGGVAPGPEAGRLGLSADPRYGAQFPGRPPAPQLDPALAQRANEAASRVGYDQFRDVPGRAIPLEEIGGALPEISDKVSPVLQDQIRQRNIQNWMATNPEYNAWKEAAQAAFADAQAKGLPAPRIDGPTFVGDPRRLPSKEKMDEYYAARKQRTQERRDRIMAQMERNRAAAAIRSLRDPQTRNAVLAAGLFGGQMPENAAIALAMMGHPDAARLFSQSRIAAQESADRRYVADRGLEGQQWIAYNRDLENWREEQKEYNKQINDMIARGDAATREDAEYLLGRQGITLRPRPTRPGQAEPGASAGPQLPGPAAPGGQSQPPQANNEIPRTRQDEVELGNELRNNAKDLKWFVKNYQRLQRLPKEKRAQILRDSITTEQAEKYLDRVFIEGTPEAEAAKELGEIFGIKVKTVYDESVPWAY